MTPRLTTDPKDLEGSWYVWFIPGACKSHERTSPPVYLHITIAYTIEKLLEQYIPHFSIYSIVETTGEHAHAFAEAALVWADALDHMAYGQQIPARYKVFTWARDEFAEGEPEDPKAMATMLRDLGTWIKAQVPRDGHLCIHGM